MLGLILEEKKKGEEDMKIKIIFFGRMRKPKVYGRLVNEETYLQFRLIEHNGMGGRRILLMLRLQRKRRTRDRVKERSRQACQFQPQGKSKGYAHWKDKAKLKVTYPPLSGKCKMGSCLPLTASRSIGRSSFYRWLRSGRLGLAGRLKFIGPFLTGAGTFMTLTIFS